MQQENTSHYSRVLVLLLSLILFFSLMLSCVNLPDQDDTALIPEQTAPASDADAELTDSTHADSTGLPAFRASLNDDITFIPAPQTTVPTAAQRTIRKIPLNRFARQTQQGLKITLSDRGLFDPNTTNLSATARSKLASLAEFLLDNPNRRVIIEGYDNGNGSKDYLVGLSRRYAQTIRLALVSQTVASTRLQVRSFGNSQPTGNTVQRVEILVLN